MSTESKITAREMGDMIEHWLKTPVGAYLGSDYGSDKLSLLQIPLTDTTAADEFVRKLSEDVPLVGAAGGATLYQQDEAPDKKHVFMTIAGQTVDVGEASVNYKRETE